MSFFLSVIRIIKFAFQNIFRNFWLSFITMSIFVLTLMTVNTVLLLNYLADVALGMVQDKVEVTVYFTPETSEDIVKAAEGYTLGLNQVKTTSRLTAEEALETFVMKYEQNQYVLDSLEEVDGNPFGPALVVSAHDPNDFPFILEALQTPEFSGYIKDQDLADYESVIDRIETVGQQVRIGGLALALFFTLIAILIVFNTIRVAIYVHREEISIMKLVGANDWFIRGPFLLEATIYSIVATGIIVGVIYLGMEPIQLRLGNYFSSSDLNIQLLLQEHGLYIFGAQCFALMMLSILTTAFAMRRYLRV